MINPSSQHGDGTRISLSLEQSFDEETRKKVRKKEREIRAKRLGARKAGARMHGRCTATVVAVAAVEARRCACDLITISLLLSIISLLLNAFSLSPAQSSSSFHLQLRVC